MFRFEFKSMENFARKLINILPLYPRIRHHIFSGSNNWKEWFLVLKRCLLCKGYRDETVIREYETKFSKKVDTDFAYSFGAGRMALYAILEALGIKEGDEVIIPAYTCVVVPNAVLYRGAKPIYVDIEKNTCNIDVSKIENAISSKTKAIFAQHTFGFPCNIAIIKELATKYNLKIIEDCAHALGATYQGRPVGSLGDVAFFSTDHSKITSTFLGGMVTTSDAQVSEELKRIQLQTPFLPKYLQSKLLFGFLLEFPLYSAYTYWFGKFILSVLNKLRLVFYWRDELLHSKPELYPYPARLSAHQALIGISQLKRLDDNIAHRRKVCEAIDGVLRSDVTNYSESACLRYSFYVKDRNKFESLFQSHWDLGIWFTSIAQGKNENLDEINYEIGSCPNAEYAAKHLVNFPTHQRTPVRFAIKEIEKHSSWIKNNYC